MKIKNIADSIERQEVKSAKYSRCHYHSVEPMSSFALSELITDSEYQFVIKEKHTKEQIKERFEKLINGQKHIYAGYLEAAKGAEVKLCYFPIYYMRVDGYKYTVGFESACRSSVRSFGLNGKKDHYADLFCADAEYNRRFFDLRNNTGDDARKKQYASITVLSNNDMNKTLTISEFKDGDSGEIFSAEYQILQTVYYPIWQVSVMFDGEERISYVSDSEDYANLTVAYSQSQLDDISRGVRRVRRFFCKCNDVALFAWSWVPVLFLCFITGILMNIRMIFDGRALSVTTGVICAMVISVILHWVIYYLSFILLEIYKETSLIKDGVIIGEEKAKALKYLFILSISVLPIIITVVAVLIE